MKRSFDVSRATHFTAGALAPLFRPVSIAVVGASNDPSRIGGLPLEYLRTVNYPGDVIGINPKYSTVQGYPCISSIAGAPAGIDLYILAIPASGVPSAIADLGERGGRAAVVFSGGFSEAGADGEKLQQQLQDSAGRYGLPVLGPNCLGMVSFHDASPATFSSSLRPLLSLDAGRVAIVSQSGGFAGNLAVEAAVHGARFSYMVATGNEAVVEIGDVFNFLASDENTDMVIGYMEGVRDGAKLAFGLSQLQSAGKRVCLMKVGRSRLGAAAVGGHTALMSGANDAVDACFRRYGVTRINTFDEMVDLAVAGSRNETNSPDGRGLAVATISGGTAVYILDACEELKIPLAKLSPETTEGLERLLPSFARVGNPVDLTAQVVNDPSMLVGSLELLSDDPVIGEILFFLGGQDNAADTLLPLLANLRATREGRLSLAWLGVSEHRRMQARDAGIRTFADPARFLRTLSSSVNAPTTTGRGVGPTANQVSDDQLVASGPDAFVASELTTDDFVVVPGGGLALDEWHGMSLLREAGVPVPRQWQWNIGDSDSSMPMDVVFPCVVKLLRPHLTHRSRAGGVITNISSNAELWAAGHELRRRLQAEVLLVAEQVPSGPELIIGVMRDATFGQRAVLGSGGVWANETKDFLTVVPPFTAAYVRKEIAELALYPRLLAASPNVAEVVAAVLERMSSLLAEQPLLEQLECNPLVLTPDGVMAVDALGAGRRSSVSSITDRDR